MINNYDMKNRNYETFFNLKEIINSDIIKDIMRINNENIIFEKFKSIINIYNKLQINEIKLNIKIEKVFFESFH